MRLMVIGVIHNKEQIMQRLWEPGNIGRIPTSDTPESVTPLAVVIPVVQNVSY